MTENEAKDAVKYLRGLFPNLTPEQGQLCGRTFLAYDAKIVRQVCDRHRLSQVDFISISNLAEGLRAAVAVRMACRAQERAAEERTAAEWQNVDKLIDEMSDEELEEMKTHVLTTCPDLKESGRSLLGAMNPRKSKTIRGLIAKSLKSPPPAVRLPSGSTFRGAAGVVASDLDL